MRKDPEPLATQRLLEVIRGKPVSPYNSAQGQSPPESMQEQGSGVLEPGEVLLSSLEPSRSKFRTGIRVGLDIGRSLVKMVRLERTPRSVRLLQVGMACVKSSSGDSSERVEAAAALLKDLKGSPVVTCLGDADTLVRQISFPRMPPRQLAQAMEFEARKHMPYDPGKMLLRHQVLSEDKKNSTFQILLVAVAREALREHQALLKRLGLEPHAIEVAPLALANASLLASQQPQETKVVMDMGTCETLITVHRNEGMFFSRYIPLSLGPQGREDQKIEEASLEELLVEIRRSLAYYDNVTGRMGFSRVMLAGGGAMVPGVGPLLQEKLGLPVEPLNPMPGLHWQQAGSSQHWVVQSAPLWALALGSTLGH
ncbi:MAG: pilus assembly protein PilM [bacterium]